MFNYINASPDTKNAEEGKALIGWEHKTIAQYRKTLLFWCSIVMDYLSNKFS